jgi:hypothetical protein
MNTQMPKKKRQSDSQPMEKLVIKGKSSSGLGKSDVE